MTWTDTVTAPPILAYRKPKVAVVGAGVAGLTAAYKLAKEGFDVSVYEAAARLGGRIYTDMDAFSSQIQFCEKGGEWIDSTHHAIRNLAHELKLDIQDVTKVPDIGKRRVGEELFYFDGQVFAPKDFIAYNKGTEATEGAFVELARYIGRDRRHASQDKHYEQKLDAMSIDNYLSEAAAKTKTPSWVVESIRAAYKGEFGTETAEQSALLLINQIGTSFRRPFEVYGPKQDESQRIRGGNHILIEALQRACNEMGVKIFTHHKLTKIDFRDDLGKPPVFLKFDDTGHRRTANFDFMISAIPFTKLRDVEGLDKLAERKLLSPEKLNCIRDMGYGNITKIMFGMHGKPWENNPRFPIPSNGSFRTDNRYLQNTWITSVGQGGQDSIITVLVAGHEAKQPISTIARECKKAIAELFDKPEAEVFNHRHAFHIWPKYEFTKGSYSSFKPGQYTTLRLSAGTPEANGRLGFIGEHTDPEHFGYMNGAVASGIHEAKRITELEKARVAQLPPPQAQVS